MKKSYDLTILNQKFTIKSEADEKHVKKVADYVNKKMFEIVSGNKAIATANVAILAALNIADDFYKFREEKNTQVTQWAGRLEDLVKKADSK
jgi:cell division protein ZapA